MHWSQTDERAVLNILIIQAMILLLTFSPQADSDIFKEILDMWFCDPPPQAYLVDTSEEALLIPDWLKLKLISSQNQKLVDAALKDLEPRQLILFIQSFGIPIPSMEKLLHLLDAATEQDEEMVKCQISDMKFMRQLIEVQWMRGVTTGRKFGQLVGLEGEDRKSVIKTAITTNDNRCSVIQSNVKSEVTTLEIWLENTVENLSYLKNLCKGVAKELVNKQETRKRKTKEFLTSFHRIMTNDDSKLRSSLMELLNYHELNSIFNTILTLSRKCDDKEIRELLILAKKDLFSSAENVNETLKRLFERFII